MNLYPTKTRLALLMDVHASRIRRITPHEGDPYVQDFGMRRVTASIAELEWAGWVEPDPDDIEETFSFQVQHYRLTDAGKKVLADG